MWGAYTLSQHDILLLYIGVCGSFVSFHCSHLLHLKGAKSIIREGFHFPPSVLQFQYHVQVNKSAAAYQFHSVTRQERAHFKESFSDWLFLYDRGFLVWTP